VIYIYIYICTVTIVIFVSVFDSRQRVGQVLPRGSAHAEHGRKSGSGELFVAVVLS